MQTNYTHMKKKKLDTIYYSFLSKISIGSIITFVFDVDMAIAVIPHLYDVSYDSNWHVWYGSSHYSILIVLSQLLYGLNECT